MQLTPARVAVIAIASALATVGVLELLRARPATVERSVGLPVEPKDDSVVERTPRVDPLDPPRDPAGSVRLDELEARIAALEEALRSQRRPVAGDPAAADPEALRALVLDVVAEEREARRLRSEEEAEAKRREELEFDARMQVAMVTEELALADWEKERLVEIMVEHRTREGDLLGGVDPTVTSPEELEREMKELQAWLRRRVEEELGPARALSLLGE